MSDVDELVDLGALLAMSVDILAKRRLERSAIVEISGGGKASYATPRPRLALRCRTCPRLRPLA